CERASSCTSTRTSGLWVSARPMACLSVSLGGSAPCAVPRTSSTTSALRMGRPLAPLAHALDEHVEDRDEEEVEQRREDHPARDRGAERVAAVLARAGGEHQRQDAEDEGERGHEDRAQADARRLDRGRGD